MFTLTATKNGKGATKDTRAITIGKYEFSGNVLEGAYHDLIALVARNPECRAVGNHMELIGAAALPPGNVQEGVKVKSVGRLPLSAVFARVGGAFDSLTFRGLMGPTSKCERKRRPVRIRHAGGQVVLSAEAETSSVFAGQDLGDEWELSEVMLPGEGCPCDDSINLVIELMCP